MRPVPDLCCTELVRIQSHNGRVSRALCKTAQKDDHQSDRRDRSCRGRHGLHDRTRKIVKEDENEQAREGCICLEY